MIVESVPNFSEGRRFEVIQRLAAAAGPRLLDADPDGDHNRLVLSIGGAAEAVLESVFEAIAIAVETIDLRAHRGVHPRVGAADVVPFIPLRADDGLGPCVEIAHRLGERVWDELRVPVVYYGAAAPGGRRALREIRGPSPPPPDLGNGRHPTAGWVCIGVRWPLIAYNVLLPGVPVATAALIAKSIRWAEGGPHGVQALGFPVTLGSQVSMNLTAPDVTPPAAALAAVQLRAAALGVRAGADEVVGLCPVAFGLPAASGALLECRLAAAGCRLAAGVASGRGDGPGQRLAEQFTEAGARLATLPFERSALSAGAAEIDLLSALILSEDLACAEALDLLSYSAAELRRAGEA